MNEEKQTQKKSTIKNGDKLKNSSKAAQYAKGKFRTGRKDNSLTLEEKMELAKLRKQGRKAAQKQVARQDLVKNAVRSADAQKPEKWETVWFSQWEPADKKTQWAHDCYVNRFGTCLDLDGKDTTNEDINAVDKSKVPNHTLLVGGFPCQDYSVASTLATSKGLEGKKGVLWWDIRDMLEAKNTPFVLLENCDLH